MWSRHLKASRTASQISTKGTGRPMEKQVRVKGSFPGPAAPLLELVKANNSHGTGSSRSWLWLFCRREGHGWSDGYGEARAMSECAEVGMQDFEAGEGLLTQRKLQNSSQNRKIRFEMGIVITTIEVGDLQGRNSRRVEVEVDTGSTYTALPRDMLQALGVQVRRTVASRLADGSEKPVQVGYANVRLAGAELITPVIFAEEGEPSLLGVITLEDAPARRGPREQ